MSFTLRYSIVFRRRLTVHNFQATLSRSSSKEAEEKSVYNDLGDNPSTIFDYIYKNQNSLSGQNCVEALRKLSKCFLESNTRPNNFTDKKNLLLLCSELDKRTKTLHSSQAVEAIQLLPELGISPKTIIFQSLLKNIQTNFHTLTVEDVGELNKILSQMKKWDLTDTMKIVLILISQSQQKTTSLNIVELCNRLYRAVNGEFINRNIVNSILNEISKYSYEIPPLIAKSIFVSSTKIPDIMLPQFSDLLRMIKDTLINQAHTFRYQSILQILAAMTDALKDNNFSDEFYSDQLIDTLINTLLSRDNLKLEEGIELLLKLRFIGHLEISLIDYLAFKCFEESTLISRMKRLQLLQFVSGLTLSNYKPPFWESIQQLIVDNENLKSNPYILIRILCNLATMEFFPHNSISTLFQLKKEHYDKMKFKTVCRLRLLCQLIKTLCPNYSGSWPSESVLNSIFDVMKCDSIRSSAYPLLPALEKALGGSQYIKTKVRTKLGHIIDHVIVMRKGAFPIAINQERDKNNSNYEKQYIPFVEDIIVPQESQMIAILSLDSGAYLRNFKQLRGHLQASVKSLEALKYTVIHINVSEWMNLDERDKIPFIMNQIRLKFSTDSILVNV